MFGFRMKILMGVMNRGAIRTFLMSCGCFWVSFTSMSTSSFNLKTICTWAWTNSERSTGPPRSNPVKLPRFYRDWLEKSVVNSTIDLFQRPFTVCFGTPKSRVCVWVTTRSSSSLWCWKKIRCVHWVRKKKEKKKKMYFNPTSVKIVCFCQGWWLSYTL